MKNFNGVNEVIHLSNYGEFSETIDAAINVFWSNYQLVNNELIENWQEKYRLNSTFNYDNQQEVTEILRKVFAGNKEVELELLKEINFFLTFKNQSSKVIYPTDVKNHSVIK